MNATKLLSRSAVAAAALLSSGCYHAVVESGRPTSTEIVERRWAHSFLFGLVGPQPVQTAARCPNGLARVETQHSFVNALVGVVTFGVYTPLTIRATCASSRGAGAPAARTIQVGEHAAPEQRAAAVGRAADVARELSAPVDVRF